MVLGGIRIGQVDGVWVVRVLCYVGKVQAESLAKATELDLALMLQAELEGLLSDLLYHQDFVNRHTAIRYEICT